MLKKRKLLEKEIKKEVVDRVEPRPIVQEMEESYLDYAMSVIISRALPDVRDGLKPVHRRILYAMWDMGLKSNVKFRKSATVVGETLGKYHPHGDISVYDAMARMAQDFAMRYPLVWGQGNWGSIDGDSPAAMRYTEAKLKNIAEELLYDIERDTVNFIPNYDDSHKEPAVLPARLPNLILNGTIGIAVGMATNIPPHNLSEVCQGIIYLIDHPHCAMEDLFQFIKGPDFPTGGVIYDSQAIAQAYGSGRGGIVMRAKTDIMEAKNGFQIIVNEIPYQVNKAALLEKIASLVRDKKIEGIKDLRDESNKEGIRVVIELKRDSYPKKVLNRLFNLTQLQDTFHFNTLALVDGIQPRILNLKAILEYFVKHRYEVITRRCKFDLTRAEERSHILKGLMTALKYLDAVIKLIKKSKDKEQAKINLIKKYRLSEIQALAILEMKLQQLAGLERLKIENELKERLKLIQELKSILASPQKIKGIIKKEISEIKEKYGDERRTKIIPHPVGEFKAEDLIPNEPTVVIITRDGYIKRLSPETFRTQSRGGKGVIGLTTKELDIVEHFFSTKTHNDLLFFTTRGRAFKLKAYDVPPASRTAKGHALQNFLQLSSEEKVSTVLSLDDLKDCKYLVMATNRGLIKKVDITSFSNIRQSGLIALKLKDDDYLEWVKPSGGKDDIVLATAGGQSIRFKEDRIRAMGRIAAGVKGIRLRKGDQVVAMDIVSHKLSLANAQLLVIMENGFGKRSLLKNHKTQGRGGSGLKAAKVTEKTGKIVTGYVIDAKEKEEEDLIIISSLGQVIRLPFKSIPVLGRDTQGVHLMRFKEKKDKVANVTFV